MIRWAILKQLYENLNTTCLKNQIKKKDFQSSIDDPQGKYVVHVDHNIPCGYFTSEIELGKIWSKLKSLHASHTVLSEVFHYFRNLQNPLTLELLDMKKENSLEEDQLI